MELLFESRLAIKAIHGKLYAFQTTPTVTPEPVLQPDTFVDGLGASIYGSVLHDGGVYRMWYQAWPTDWDGGDVSLVGYAESDDGFRWRKPELGIVDHGPGNNHLCDLGFHSPSVFIDPNASPSYRYRAAGFTRPKRVGSVDVARAGYFTSHSSDGFHWELDSTEPRWVGGDVITTVYHPRQNRGVVSLKHTPRAGGIPRRSIWQAAMQNGQWTTETSALIPDEFDDVGALGRGFASGDYYGMGLMPAGTGLVGFLWQFRHTLPRTAQAESGVFGRIDVTLVYQDHPGDRWMHSFGRADFLSCRDLPWSQGGIYTSSSPVDVGDETRLYFSGATHSHGWYLDSQWHRLEPQMDQLREEGMARIGYASWPKDRIFGFRADPTGTIEIDIGEISVPSELRLNYRCSHGGSVRAEIIECEGYGLPDAKQLEGDSLDEAARWERGTLIKPVRGNAVIARIHLTSAQLFAYEVRPVE